jgi:hypothetical protein
VRPTVLTTVGRRGLGGLLRKTLRPTVGNIEGLTTPSHIVMVSAHHSAGPRQVMSHESEFQAQVFFKKRTRVRNFVIGSDVERTSSCGIDGGYVPFSTTT